MCYNVRMEKRFFITKDNILDDEIILRDEEHNHLSRVLRLSVGDIVECFEDGGDILSCEIEGITKSQTNLKVLSSKKCNSNPKSHLTIFQGLTKGEKLEWIIQKTSELGAYEIRTFTSNFTIAKPNDNKAERSRKIAISSAKQCGRTAVIKVYPTITFKQMLPMLKDYDIVIFANETEDAKNIRDVFTEEYKNVAIIVGAEGGFSREEIDSIINNGGVSVSLGNRILRAETAAIAMSSVVLYELGELNK